MAVNVLRSPGPTKGCRANDDGDDDDACSLRAGYLRQQKNTPRICNTYYFTKAATVTRTLLKYIACLIVYTHNKQVLLVICKWLVM